MLVRSDFNMHFNRYFHQNIPILMTTFGASDYDQMDPNINFTWIGLHNSPKQTPPILTEFL